MLFRHLPIVLLVFVCHYATAGDNLVLVTVDGVRWQEVFRGIDQRLVNDERYTERPEELNEDFSADSAVAARQKLFPFIWTTIAEKGVLIGDRDNGSKMDLTNPWYFSYPGYNEILTGRADPEIDSNHPTPNPNVTFLEWLNGQAPWEGKIQAFGSWDVFPAIINEERSGVPVNAGFESANRRPSEKEKLLNQLQKDIPSPWHNVRLDAFTHHYATEALRQDKPRVIYIAYGEPDDFGHDGEYHNYIRAAHRFDGFIEDLWHLLQADRRYRNKTVLLITTDHGRGEVPVEGWQHHGSKQALQAYLHSPHMEQFKEGIVGAEQVWLAAIGPGIRSAGLLQRKDAWLSDQIAATALTALDVDYREYAENIGQPIQEIFEGESR